MKLYDINKTIELNREGIDLSIGYLKLDRLFVAHHEAIPFKAGKTAEELYAELKRQGIEVREYGGEYYRVLESYDEGAGEDLEQIEAEPDTQAKEAWDEYEDIQVYVPYNDEQLKDMLRAKRTPLLNAFDKWEKAVLRGRELDDTAIMEWYKDLLDLKEEAFENIPNRVQYYL